MNNLYSYVGYSTLIYYLTKKGEDIPMYIGHTTNIRTRLHQHRVNYKKRGILIDIVVIDQVPVNRLDWEYFYMDLFKSWGFKLESSRTGKFSYTRLNFSPTGKIINKIKLKWLDDMAEYKKMAISNNMPNSI